MYHIFLRNNLFQKIIFVFISLFMFFVFSLGNGLDLWNDDGLSGSYGSQPTGQEFSSLKQLQEAAPNAFTPSSFINSFDVAPAQQAGGGGRGETIAFLEAGNDYDMSAFQNFNKFFQLPKTNPIFISHGKPIKPSVGNNDSEILLDTEWAHVIAPNARLLILDINSNKLNDIKSVFHRYSVSSVSVTIGSYLWDLSTRNPIPYFFLRLFDAGFWKIDWISSHYPTFVSSGDNGADISAAALIPQSVMVGGIQANVFDKKSELSNPKSYQIWSNEGFGIEWFDLGGIHYPGFWRRIPDVAWLAGYPGVVILDKNGWLPPNGTSIASPLWAALWVLADANHLKLQHAHLPTNANVVLYDVNREHANSFINNSDNTHTPKDVWGLGFPNPPALVQNLGDFKNSQAVTYYTWNFAQVPFWFGTAVIIFLAGLGFVIEQKTKKSNKQNPFIVKINKLIPVIFNSTMILLCSSIITDWMVHLIPIKQYLFPEMWIPARFITFLILALSTIWIIFLISKRTFWPHKKIKRKKNNQQ